MSSVDFHAPRGELGGATKWRLVKAVVIDTTIALG